MNLIGAESTVNQMKAEESKQAVYGLREIQSQPKAVVEY